MKIVKLKNVAKITTGKTPHTDDNGNFSGIIPFVKPPNLGSSIPVIQTAEYLSKKGAASVNIIPKNSIMVCCIGSLGKVGIAGQDLATNQQINSLTFDPKLVDYKFGYYFALTLAKKLDRMAHRAVVPIVNKTAFSNLDFVLIPLSDQKRIVKILDEAEALRQKRKQAIGLLDDYLKSVFLDMFGDPVKNEKGWETKKTSEVITEKAQNGFFAKNEHYAEFGTPVIWISDFINLPYARVKNLKRANATSKDKQQYKVKYGDVLFCRSSLTVEGIGKCSIIPENIPEDTIYECHIIKISLNKEIILPEYFREFSKTAYFRNQIMQKAKTSTMTTIAQGGILETLLLIPPMELQKSFLNVIKKQEILIDKMLLQSAELETQFQALMQIAFKGEL